MPRPQLSTNKLQIPSRLPSCAASGVSRRSANATIAGPLVSSELNYGHSKSQIKSIWIVTRLRKVKKKPCAAFDICVETTAAITSQFNPLASFAVTP